VLTAAVFLPIPTQIVTVLDACDDGSAELAGGLGDDVDFVDIDACNVGAGRAAGFAYARSIGGVPDSVMWYATTDAESRVGPDWLLRQVRAGADMVLGVVHVAQGRHQPPVVAARYLSTYPSNGPCHGHVHGANLGCRRRRVPWVRFRGVGKRRGLELVERFQRAGYVICRDARLLVATSDRHTARPGRFCPPPQRAVAVGAVPRGGRAGVGACRARRWLAGGAPNLALPGPGNTV
jgi:hypothetical protein